MEDIVIFSTLIFVLIYLFMNISIHESFKLLKSHKNKPTKAKATKAKHMTNTTTHAHTHTH